jgi:predicted amidohydrolase
LIQTELVWEGIEANLKQLTQKIDAIEMPTDIIILPEMFTTGFSMNATKLAQKMNGSAVEWLRKTSIRSGTHIVGSLIIQDCNRFYNRLCWASSDGSLQIYDKRHLFRMAGEEKVYTAGENTLVVRLKEWNVRPFICYDLRFPVWSRNVDNHYDLAIYIANWPASRANHWKTLLQARAIENQAYVVGVNRVGTDGKGRYHSGDSSVFDPSGQRLYHSGQIEASHTLTLIAQTLKQHRAEFPVWMDADPLDLKMFETKPPLSSSR